MARLAPDKPPTPGILSTQRVYPACVAQKGQARAQAQAKFAPPGLGHPPIRIPEVATGKPGRGLE